MTARQIPLDLPVRAARGRAQFYVSGSNEVAVRQVDDWRAWPGGRLALTGPEGAGKSHLAAVWADEAGAAAVSAAALPELDLRDLASGGAAAVEDADRLLDEAGERALFHLHNLMDGTGALLVTGREAPARWPVRLPDLRTRLAALPVARIEPPDDRLMEALAVKLFADRQVAVEPELPRYLAQRAPRSHRALALAVEEIDRAALAAGLRPSRRVAGPVLARLFG